MAVCNKYPDNPGQGFPPVVPEGVILQHWVQSAPPPDPYNYVGETYISR